MKIEEASSYYLKAVDSYNRGDLEEAFERITYTLSYNENHAGAYFLLGKIYENHLYENSLAIEHYLHAILLNKEYIPTYPWYANLLIQLEKYEEAIKIINLALEVPAIHKGHMYRRLGEIDEAREKYDEAIDSFKRAKYVSRDDSFRELMNKALKRIKNKKKEQTK